MRPDELASGDPRRRSARMRRTLVFGVFGLLLTLILLAPDGTLEPAALPLGGAVLPLSGAILAGLGLRAARRRRMFPHRSLHEAFALDSLFQGAILFFPQLPYPDVERNFLALFHGKAPHQLAPWFEVRIVSAGAIPLLLAAMVFALAGWTLAAGACVLAAVLWMAARSTRALSGKPGHPGVLPAVLLGAAGVLGEGLGFSFAARALFAGFEPWQAFLTYALLLTAFELSPAPLALGILELAGAVASLVLTGSHWAGAVLACLYRLWRATPVCLLVLFYMPRYKMRPRDLFDPELPAVLARLRQRPGEADDRAAGPLLSVVLPAYNEEQRLPQYLPQVIEFCRRLEGGAEIVVVDDGSRDGTAAYIERGIAAEPTLRLVRMGQNQGKGAAVCRGVREAHGSYVLFADADGATPIGEATKLIEAAARGADVVIGSRKAAAAGVARERSWLRELAGTVFYRITNLLAVPHVEDTQCGFKLFRRSAAGPIFALVTEKGWAFDVQVLFLAQKLGFQIEEVPVNWRSVEGSKIRSSDALRMFAALFRIRRRSAGLTGDGDGA